MADQVKTVFLDADSPITDDSAERLGRTEFVRLMARRVLSYRGERALVVGVCGSWGSGKTSIANLLVNEVRDAREESDRPILEPVMFTPWALGSREDLARDLLQEIGRMVRDRSGAEKAGIEIGTQIAEVGTALAVAGGMHAAGAPAWVSGAVATASISSRVRGAIAQLSRKRVSPSLQEATERVSKRLKTQDALLLVVLDDLDRLPIEQIHAVFRVVKAVADFPNTVYILCMDRARVAEALDREYCDGKAYLEKFLNLTFDVPPPDPDLMGALFVERLNEVLAGRQIEWDDIRFGEVWRVGLRRIIQTPRDIVRVLNSFDMALDSIADETDPVDLLSLEALRVTHPDVHLKLARRPFGVLRDTKDLFARVALHGDAERVERAKADYEAIISRAPEGSRDCVNALLEVVFPAVRKGGYLDADGVHRAKRAASIDHFDHYFRWSLASGSLSEVELLRELDRLVQAARDPEIEDWCARNDTRFLHIGEKLSHYVDEFGGDERRLDLAAGLLRAGHMLDDHQPDIHLRTKHLTALRLAYRLLRGRTTAWDSELWSRCQETSWLYGLTHFLAMEFKKGKSGRLDLDPPSEETIRAVSAALRVYFDQGAYDAHPNLPGFLYRWRDLGDPAAPRSWVQEKVASNDALVWSIIDTLVIGGGRNGAFDDDHTIRNREQLEGLFDLDQLRSYVDAVPHPRREESVVLATRRALEMDES